jgi:2-methylisocitrate lyase-like PEP mutase family enzyme
MPSCFDGLSAKMIEQEGFDLSFMSGFAASASRIGAPDLGLMSYGEVLDQARNVTEASTIPVIVDGDTGYGNAMNVYRTGQWLCQSWMCRRADRRSAIAKTLWAYAGQRCCRSRGSL